MQSNSRTEGMGFLPVDRIALVVVCENQDEECLQSVSKSQQHFPDDNIYILDCSDASSSFYTMQDVMDENDLHMVNYVNGRDKDKRAALQQMCCKYLKKYDYVFLVNPAMTHRRRMKRFSSSSSLSSDTASETSCTSISSSSFVDLPYDERNNGSINYFSLKPECTKSSALLKGVGGELWTCHSLKRHLGDDGSHARLMANAGVSLSSIAC